MPRSLVLRSALVAAIASLCLTSACSAPEPVGSPAPTTVQTVFPDLTPAPSQTTMPGLLQARPAAGTVVLVDGPFNDRFHIDHLAFDGTQVTGEVVVTSDISEIIDLQVQVGFHDAEGALIGTSTFDHHGHGHDEADHADHVAEDHPKVDFEVVVPAAITGTAVAASVGVPVLVNE